MVIHPNYVCYKRTCKQENKKKEDIVVCNIQRFLKERKNMVVVIGQNALKHMANFGIVRIRESCIWDPVHRRGGVLVESELLDDRPNHWEIG